MTMKKINPGQNLPHNVLYPLRGQARRRALLDVKVEVLVDVLEHQVEHHLPVHPLAVADIQQPGEVQHGYSSSSN